MFGSPLFFRREGSQWLIDRTVDEPGIGSRLWGALSFLVGLVIIYQTYTWRAWIDPEDPMFGMIPGALAVLPLLGLLKLVGRRRRWQVHRWVFDGARDVLTAVEIHGEGEERETVIPLRWSRGFALLRREEHVRSGKYNHHTVAFWDLGLLSPEGSFWYLMTYGNPMVAHSACRSLGEAIDIAGARADTPALGDPSRFTVARPPQLVELTWQVPYDHRYQWLLTLLIAAFAAIPIVPLILGGTPLALLFYSLLAIPPGITTFLLARSNLRAIGRKVRITLDRDELTVSSTDRGSKTQRIAIATIAGFHHGFHRNGFSTLEILTPGDVRTRMGDWTTESSDAQAPLFTGRQDLGEVLGRNDAMNTIDVSGLSVGEVVALRQLLESELRALQAPSEPQGSSDPDPPSPPPLQRSRSRRRRP